MRTGVIVAARSGSSRLPGKAMLPLLGMPMVSFLLHRLKVSKRIDCLILATTRKRNDDQLEELAKNEGVLCFRGDENNLIKRYIDAARQYDIDRIVRVTADCPFVSSETLDHCLALCDDQIEFDLASTKKLFPVGVDYEVFYLKRLVEMYENGSVTKEEQEHLTLHMVHHADKYNIFKMRPQAQWHWEGRDFTVDTKEDYEWATALVNTLGKMDFSLEELLEVARNEQ